MTAMILPNKPHLLFCEYIKYRENAKKSIERELRSRGVADWLITEAVKRFDEQRMTEKEVIEMYLKR